MYSFIYMDCCGWAELYGVQKYDSRNFPAVLSRVKTISKGALLFSSAHRVSVTRAKTGAIRLAKDIQSAGLGDVVALPVFRNPNTGRFIVTFMWILDNTRLYQYCIDNNIKSASNLW